MVSKHSVTDIPKLFCVTYHPSNDWQNRFLIRPTSCLCRVQAECTSYQQASPEPVHDCTFFLKNQSSSIQNHFCFHRASMFFSLTYRTSSAWKVMKVTAVARDCWTTFRCFFSQARKALAPQRKGASSPLSTTYRRPSTSTTHYLKSIKVRLSVNSLLEKAIKEYTL